MTYTMMCIFIQRVTLRLTYDMILIQWLSTCRVRNDKCMSCSDKGQLPKTTFVPFLTVGPHTPRTYYLISTFAPNIFQENKIYQIFWTFSLLTLLDE
jgi:hypothetical protein